MSFLRNSWRQLTSMRTALFLLFLLAVAAVPGSILPQRSVKTEDVTRYYQEHPDLAPVLEKLSLFDVFAAPWFAAIYLLLFTSLIGCVVPRLLDHVSAIKSKPPNAPKNLSRLPQHATVPSLDVDLKGWRTVRTENTVSAEKGYLKETGNLLFHSALLIILIGVGVGSRWGWHGNRLLVAGPEQAFCMTLQQFDEYGLGGGVTSADLPKHCLELKDFEASFMDNGMPEWFEATVNEGRKFRVNHPLRLDGANVYLLGHGYAAELRYTDAAGKTQTAVVPFLPTDGLLTSRGVAAFPDANGGDQAKQIAFEGLYLPTAGMGVSTHPEERDPALVLMAYQGNLGLDSGIAGSVYELRKDGVKQVGDKRLKPGEKWTLDDKSTLEFVRTRPWVTISVRHDPGEPIVLVGAVLLVVGLPLSLYGKRRRIWLRRNDDGTVEVGGLPRNDYPGFPEEFTKLVEKWQQSPTTP